MFILKKFKSRARISKLSNKDYESIRSHSKGRLSYVSVQKLKSLAKSLVGYDTHSDRLFLKYSIKHYEDLSEIIKSVEYEIILLMENIDQTPTNHPRTQHHLCSNHHRRTW